MRLRNVESVRTGRAQVGMSRQGHTRLSKSETKGWALTADANASFLKARQPRASDVRG